MKTWTREQIDHILSTQDLAVERGIVQLYKLQTDDEKRSESTRLNNGVGFNSSSAGRGTYYAKWVLSGRHLTGVHLLRARSIALRHSRQLVDIANENEKRRDAEAFERICAG